MNSRERAINNLPKIIKTINDRKLPIDPDKLQIEILDKGADAALPHNLSDDWLHLLVHELLRGCYDRQRARQTFGWCSAPYLLAISIKDAEMAFLNKTASTNSYMAAFILYRIALFQEVLGRHTGIFRHEYSVEDFYRKTAADFEFDCDLLGDEPC